MKDDPSFVFTGLWEGWKDPANDQWLHTCTIITGEPNEFVREIHTRMLSSYRKSYHESLLSGEAGKEVLVPYPADRIANNGKSHPLKRSPVGGVPPL